MKNNKIYDFIFKTNEMQLKSNAKVSKAMFNFCSSVLFARRCVNQSREQIQFLMPFLLCFTDRNY